MSSNNPTKPGNSELTLAHRRDDDVEGFLGNAIDLLYIEECPAAQRFDERSVEEDLGRVALGQHAGGIKRADEPGRGELGVALDEDKFDVG